jgi:hypothetical protein
MASASNYDVHAEQRRRRTDRRRSDMAMGAVATAALVGFAALATGCAGSDGPGVAGSGSRTGPGPSASEGPANRVMAQAVAYAHCMRRHDVPDFPDPTVVRGGGVAFQINGGPGSQLNRNNPRFKAAEQACLSLLPGGGQPTALPAKKLAAEVQWAGCMRSHGLPSFPDPNAQGAFDSSKFDDSSPSFQTASEACKSLEPPGPMTAVPGHGSGS